MIRILSLFDYSGAWSLPYRQRGYETIQVDSKFRRGLRRIENEYGVNYELGCDVRELLEGDCIAKLHPCRGVLAAPPCTEFAGSGAQYWKAKNKDGRTAAALELIDATLEIIKRIDPVWWVMENPVGRLPTLRPQLGAPWFIQPHWYGDPYTKKTGLYGDFNNELERNDVKPRMYKTKTGKRGSYYWAKLGGKSEKTKELRSMTPPGFAEAFAKANP
jgi:site-specific DNA-cytosine methylase